MYVLVITRVNGETSYFGPFKSEMRANEYALAYENDMKKLVRCSIHPMIVPYHSDELVRQICGGDWVK